MSTIRVSVAQIKYKPSFATDTHDFLIEPLGDDKTNISSLSLKSNELKSKLKTEYINWLSIKISSIVAYCIDTNVDILVFPEYSIPMELLKTITSMLQECDMVVVAGSHVVRNNISALPYNYPKNTELIGMAISPVLNAEGVMGYSIKNNISKWEATLVVPDNNTNKAIHTSKCNLDIRICIDALSGENIITNESILIVPSWSPSTKPFDAVSLYAKYNETPMVYANCAQIGDSFIGAAFPENNSHWFEMQNRSMPIPKNSEALLIVDLDLSNIFLKKGSVKTIYHNKVHSIVNILYSRLSNDFKLMNIINEIDSTEEYQLLEELLQTTSDKLLIEKIKLLKRISFSGMLSKKRFENEMQYIKVNSSSFEQLLLNQAKYTFEQISQNIGNNSDSKIWAILSYLSEYVNKNDQINLSSENYFEEDDRLFIGRDHEIYKISKFFKSTQPVLTIHGLRGLGKSKLIKRIKPYIIPNNDRFELHYIKIDAGSGLTYIIDELCFSLGLSSYGEKDENYINNIVEKIYSNIIRRGQVCIIFDDINFLQAPDNEFNDKRIKIFIYALINKFDGINHKLIFITSRKKKMFDDIRVQQLELTRLDDNSISWIINYCCTQNKADIDIEIDAQTLRSIHGNPLAAIIVSQLMLEHKEEITYDKAVVFKRFEEKYIKKLIGELGFNKDEKELLSLLSVANQPVEYNFIKAKYSHLLLTINSLSNRFLIEVSNDQYISLHPIMRDYFLDLVEDDKVLETHKMYADYYEKIFSRFSTIDEASPKLISNLIYHYGGSLNNEQLIRFKHRYIEQLKPLATRLYRKQDYKNAFNYFKLLYDHSEVGPDVLLKMAQCSVYNDDINSAEKYIQKAIALKPKGAYLFAKYSISLSSEYKFLPQAEAYSMQAEDIYFKSSYGRLWELAEIKYAQARSLRWTDPVRADKLYKEACDYESTNCYYLCGYGRFLVKRENIPEAMRYYEKAKEVDSTYHGLKTLANMINDKNVDDIFIDTDETIDEYEDNEEIEITH